MKIKGRGKRQYNKLILYKEEKCRKKSYPHKNFRLKIRYEKIMNLHF